MPRLFPSWLLLGLAIGAATFLGHRPAPATAQAKQVWEVQVGGDTPDGTLTTAAFWPDAVAITAGDTVRWTFAPTSEFHTVFIQPAGRPNPATFVTGPGAGEYTLGPRWFPIGPSGPDAVYDDTQPINSGADFAGADTPPYTLTFTKPGVYQYACLLHPGMSGRVVVVPSGGSLPETPAQAQARSQVQFRQQVTGFNNAVYAPSTEAPKALVPGADAGATAGGAGVHTVAAGLASGLQVAAVRFLPGDVTVHRGETIVWSNTDDINLGHTVTLTSGATPPDFPEVRSQPSGEPQFVLTATTAQPTGGSVYAGQGYVNSGFLAPGRTFALTIDAPPGTYQYVCLVHRDVMKGTITVVDAGQ